MKTKNFLLFIFSVTAFFAVNDTHGFSHHQPVKDGEFNAATYLKVSELITLSAREFSQLTGKKMNVWDKASFAIAKIKMKHDLRKNPDLRLTDYTFPGAFFSTSSKVLNILSWILIGFLLLILIIVSIGSK